MWYNTIQIVIVLLGVPMQFIKNDMNFNYDIITSGDFQLESISAAHRYINPPHTYSRYATEHKNDRLIYIASGKITLDMYNNKPITADEGSIVYIPYNIAYKAEWDGETKGEIYSINYIMTDTKGYQITVCPELYKFTKCDNHLLKGLFMECLREFSQADFAYVLKCKYILLKLFYTAAKYESNYGLSKIGKAIKYIDINYLSDIDIKKLSKMCNMGECMFRRCFKEETGTSPLKYRNRLRIMHAYEMLTQNPYSVSEVMEMTGFYDASYFNKTFKLYTGKSPSECKSKIEEFDF